MEETYRDVFRQEADDLLARMEAAALDLEEDAGNTEAVHRLFRCMHTIKGSGSMFGFDALSAFTHHAETVLDALRKGKIAVSGELINLILAARDHIKALLESPDGRTADPAVTEMLTAALNAFLPEAKPASAQPAAGARQRLSEEVTYRIRFTPGPDIIKAGMEPALLLDELAGLGACRITAQTDRVPALEDLVPDQCYLYWDVTLTAPVDADAVRDVFLFVEHDSRIDIRAIDDDHPADATGAPPRLGEILVEKGDAAPEKIQEVLGRQKRAGELLAQSGVVPPDKIKSALSEQNFLNLKKVAAEKSSVRVPSDKLDKLINLVGELVINQARISQLAETMAESNRTGTDPRDLLARLNADFTGPAETLERLTADLRDCAIDMRMVPIGATFGKFRRLVRDISADLGKEIDLVTEGGDTELDKTVIDRINDPLVHLIRNSIDHGVQGPERRRAMGKTEKGTIRLSAAHRGADVIITVEDDGMGLDPKAIRARAAEMGVIPENAELSDSETHALIFTPGFSLARKVTALSGRGVGMDVVKRQIDALGGTIRIESDAGKFLRIRLALPLTLAIIDGLLVSVGGHCFVFPLAQVEECAELTGDMAARSRERNMLMLRDRLVPFIRMAEAFRIESQKPPIEHIAVVGADERRIGIVVDEILGNIQTVIKSLDRNCRNAEGISGAAIMGDGRVALIVDPPGLIRRAGNEERSNVKTNPQPF